MKMLRCFTPIASILIVCLVGCGKKAESPSSEGHALKSPLVVRCEAGKRGGRLTLAGGQVRSFNPLIAALGGSDSAARFLFSSLVQLDWATQKVSPGLAESWSVQPDQKTWTFKLRPGLRWSDGMPLTADDVVFTWNDVIYNPAINPAGYRALMAGDSMFVTSKVDDLTVQVTTAEPYAPFLEFFGSAWILPKHKLASAVQSRQFINAYNINTPPSEIVGSGPFRVKEASEGRYALLERNPEFWMVYTNGQRLPYFDEMMIYEAPEGAVRGAFLELKCDIYETGKPEEFPELKASSEKLKFQMETLTSGADGSFLWFNQNTGTDDNGQPLVQPEKLKWFRNKQFRQAVSCAIDRDHIVSSIYGGRARPIYSFTSSEDTQWFNPNAPRFAHDPSRARALLAEIGLEDRNGDGLIEDSDGTPVRFTLLTNTRNPLRESQARLIAGDLKKIGMQADVVLVDFPQLLEKVNNLCDYECALMGLGGGSADPTSQMNVLKSDEPLHQWFPNQKKPSTDWEARVDELMDAQMQTLDLATRQKLFNEVQAIVGEEQPMIGIVSAFAFVAFRPDLANVRAAAAVPHRITWNIQELYFKH